VKNAAQADRSGNSWSARRAAPFSPETTGTGPGATAAEAGGRRHGARRVACCTPGRSTPGRRRQCPSRHRPAPGATPPERALRDSHGV